MNELAWALVALGSTVVATNVAAVLVLRRLYKRIRRSRAINGTALRARARVNRGPRREVLKLRARLHETLDSGQAAINLTAGSKGPRGELPRLFRRLRSEGDALDVQLRLLQSENDLAALAEMLPTARHRVDHVVYVVRRLRSAVASSLGDLSDDTLMELRSEIDREITAVRAGMEELHEVTGRSVLHETRRQPSSDYLTRD